jgi:type IV secretion system protein VirB8
MTTYFDAAASWDADRSALLARSTRTAWRVAGAGWVCALTSCGALLVLMPLKSVEPFIIRVDKSSGIVDVVPVYTGHARMEEAVTRYFLAHYVSVCERFNFSTAESDYEECGAFHTAQRNQAWYALWNPSNPRSPLNIHKDGSSVGIEVTSVSFFKRASGLADLAQVRYIKAERQGSAAPERITHWIATVQYAYGHPAQDARTRRWNPLGFKVLEFTPEAEVLAEPSAEALGRPDSSPATLPQEGKP